jgi:hypothetical protein
MERMDSVGCKRDPFLFLFFPSTVIARVFGAIQCFYQYSVLITLIEILNIEYFWSYGSKNTA